MPSRRAWLIGRLAACVAALCWSGLAPGTARAAAPRDIIIDTDVGDDIDDAFALAVALRDPGVRVDLVSASFGDTALRVRLLRRFLAAAGHPEVPVAAGPPTPPGTRFTQAAWAEAGPAGPPAPDAVEAIRRRLLAAPPGRITLVALAPLTTVDALIRRDPAAFRRLKQVVMMGGSIRHGYGRQAGTVSDTPSAEYNVARDPAALRRLLASGVPVEMMPLDATEIAIGADERSRLLGGRTPLVGALEQLYTAWAQGNSWGTTPTLFDVVPVARLLRPAVCDPKPLRLEVGDNGATRPVAGVANVRACLDVDRTGVLGLVDARLAAP